MIFIFMMQLMHVAVQIVLVVDINKGGPTRDRAEGWFGAGAAGPVAVDAVLIFFVIFDGISLFLIGQLLWFHMLLRRENLTTYAYIVRESSKRRDKIMVREEIQAKRATRMARAREEGRSADVIRLRIGGLCRAVGCAACDPMEAPATSKEGTSDPEIASSFSAALDREKPGDDREQSEPTTPTSTEGYAKAASDHFSSSNGDSADHTNGISPLPRGRATSIGVGNVPGTPEQHEESTSEVSHSEHNINSTPVNGTATAASDGANVR